MNTQLSTAPALATDDALTQTEIEQATLFLQQAHFGLVGAIRGLNVEQWNFRAAAGCWTIGEITEHILFVYSRVLGPVLAGLSQAPPPPGQNQSLIDAIIIHQFPCRLTRFSAPEFAWPTGRFTSPSEALGKMEEIRSQFLTALRETPELRFHAIPAPPLKAIAKGAYEFMDGYQWMLAAVAHAERHLKQIFEVRGNPHFPQSGN